MERRIRYLQEDCEIKIENTYNDLIKYIESLESIIKEQSETIEKLSQSVQQPVEVKEVESVKEAVEESLESDEVKKVDEEPILKPVEEVIPSTPVINNMINEFYKKFARSPDKNPGGRNPPEYNGKIKKRHVPKNHNFIENNRYNTINDISRKLLEVEIKKKHKRREY